MKFFKLQNSELERALRNSSVKVPHAPALDLESATPVYMPRPKGYAWALAVIPVIAVLILIANPLQLMLPARPLRHQHTPQSVVGMQKAWSFEEGFTLTIDAFEEAIPPQEGNNRRQELFEQVQEWADSHGLLLTLNRDQESADIVFVFLNGSQPEHEFRKESVAIHLRSKDQKLCDELAKTLAALPGISMPVITEPITQSTSPRKVIINGKTLDFPGQFSLMNQAQIRKEIVTVRELGRVVQTIPPQGQKKNSGSFLRDDLGNDTYHLGDVFRIDVDQDGNLLVDTIFEHYDSSGESSGIMHIPPGTSQEKLKLMGQNSKGSERPERDATFRYEARVQYWFVAPATLLNTGGASLDPELMEGYEVTAKALQVRYDEWANNHPEVRSGKALNLRAWAGPETAGPYTVGFRVILYTDDLRELDSIQNELGKVPGLPTPDERIIDYYSPGIVKNRGVGELVERSPAPLK